MKEKQAHEVLRWTHDGNGSAVCQRFLDSISEVVAHIESIEMNRFESASSDSQNLF
jgi:hypothetical protein